MLSVPHEEIGELFVFFSGRSAEVPEALPAPALILTVGGIVVVFRSTFTARYAWDFVGAEANIGYRFIILVVTHRLLLSKSTAYSFRTGHIIEW